MNDSERPETVICRYTLKPGAEPEMLRLVARHWPTLHRVGLVTDTPPLVFRGLPTRADKEQRHGKGAGVLIEIFAWRNGQSAERAHHSPDVMAIWEPMGALCEAMEFPHFEAVALDFQR